MTTLTVQRVLPADVYDTLELSALAFGGIGAEVVDDDDGAPFCIYGHSGYATGDLWRTFLNPIADVLDRIFEDRYNDNNRAVFAINQRKGVDDIKARVTWEEYTAELHIVRGES